MVLFKEAEEANNQARKVENEKLIQDDVKFASAIQEKVRLINYVLSNLEGKTLN